jgi:hypothetical protein
MTGTKNIRPQLQPIWVRQPPNIFFTESKEQYPRKPLPERSGRWMTHKEELIRDVVPAHDHHIVELEREGSVGVWNRSCNVGAGHVDGGGCKGFRNHVPDVAAGVDEADHVEHDCADEGLGNSVRQINEQVASIKNTP